MHVVKFTKERGERGQEHVNQIDTSAMFPHTWTFLWHKNHKMKTKHQKFPFILAQTETRMTSWRCTPPHHGNQPLSMLVVLTCVNRVSVFFLQLIPSVCLSPVCVSLSPTGSPKSLTSQCRLAIRRHLRTVNTIDSIDSLDLPPCLINYLKHIPNNVILWLCL